MLKKLLYLFAVVVVVLGIGVALVIALKAPPEQEHIEGMLYLWNGAERREAFLLAWKVVGGACGIGLLFAAFGGVLDRLDRIHAVLTTSRG